MGLHLTDINKTGDGTTVTVRQGAAHIETGASEFDLDELQSAVVTALTAQTPRVAAATHPDEWENWCEERDRRADGVKAQLYSLARPHRVRQFGSVRQLGDRRGVQTGSDARCSGRLGTVRIWSLGVDRAVGMDVDR